MNARSDPAAPGRIDVVFVVLPGTLLLDIAGPAEAFRLANQRLQLQGRPPRFRLRFAGPLPEAASSVGLALAQLEPLPTTRQAARTWFVLAGRAEAARQRGTPDWLAARDWLGRTVRPWLLDGTCGCRLLTVCAGTLLAADAGLLDGRRCTTHHELLELLQHTAPCAEVLGNRVFVEDGPLASSAGITSGIDLALHLIAGEAGEAVAAAVAQTMVVYLRRGVQDPELSPLLAHRHHLHPAVHRVQDAICSDATADWSVEAMARLAHVTPRHLHRLFTLHAGIAPLAYLQGIRVERARQALAQGASVAQAAEQAGFGSELALRRAWKGRAAGTPRDARAPRRPRRLDAPAP
ncbi:GlxA family transcriptional regulator [Caldimonas thermodepolymerans]|mgnify:FL=1|uniref:GlxA family transcriptional regulator n=1 Tax=Caldimonas thermodepolymerans TaxID=215580 RepID=UPI002493A42E|nr:helix-turn-helix domain-containing protein [Caldimonas thermodepolymerans]